MIPAILIASSVAAVVILWGNTTVMRIGSWLYIAALIATPFIIGATKLFKTYCLIP